MAMRCTLSDWEVDEMLALHRGGWPTIALATFYGITERTVSRILRRERDRRGRNETRSPVT